MMNRKPPLFPQVGGLVHGGDYNPDQWLDRPDILEKDIELMKKAGINSASVGIFAWSALEPEEGKYTFEWMDNVIDRLYENGIYTVLATPSGARPYWMDEKYPEVRRIRPDGRRNLHSRRHNHCMTSPVYRKKVREMNTLLAKRYGKHPGVILWHLSNEYGGACFCDLCQQKFRDWLREKYHNDINELNHAWWTAFWSHTFTSFDHIEVPMEHGEQSVLGMLLDWRRFTTENTADFIRNEIAPLREYSDRPVTTNYMWFFDGLDYNKISKDLDIISWDAYPRWHNSYETVWDTAAQTAFNHSLMRSFKRGQPFMLMESTPSQVNWMPYNKLKRPGMHALACLQTIACGSDTIQYFQFRAGRGSFEQHHGAVVNHTGRDDTRTFREVSEVGQLLKTLAPVAGSSSVSKCAILYDLDNLWAIKDMAGAAKENKKYLDVCVEHYDALRRLGQDPDVINSLESFEGYELICAPMLYVLQPGVAQKLKDFVAAGGTLVTTWLTGYVDDTTLTFLGGFPGDGMIDLLGVEAAELDTLYPGQSNGIRVGDERYKVEDFCELLIIRSPETKVLGTYTQDFYQDEPAITAHPYGKGKAIHVAAHVEKQCLIDLYSGLYSMMGQEPELLPEGIEVHQRVNGDSTYTFWLNFSEDEVELPALKNDCRDLLTGEELKAGTRETLGAYGYLIVEEK